MNEYVDFYMQRCLQVATSIDDKSKHIILNNIKAINYEEAVKLAKTIIIDDNKRKLLLSEEVFVNDSTLKRGTGCVKIMEIIRIAVRYDNGM